MHETRFTVADAVLSTAEFTHRFPGAITGRVQLSDGAFVVAFDFRWRSAWAIGSSEKRDFFKANPFRRASVRRKSLVYIGPRKRCTVSAQT